jgi:hypothetical protein
MREPLGSAATWMVDRAGNSPWNRLPYTAFMAAKSARSTRNTVVFTTSAKTIPACSSTAAMFSITRSACAVTSPVTSSPVAGSMGI